MSTLGNKIDETEKKLAPLEKKRDMLFEQVKKNLDSECFGELMAVQNEINELVIGLHREAEKA